MGRGKNKDKGLKDITNKLEIRLTISKQSRTGFKNGGGQQPIQKGIKRGNPQSVLEEVIELLDPQTHMGGCPPNPLGGGGIKQKP